MLKEKIKEWLLHKGYRVHDVGARFLSPGDDYPVFAEKLGKGVARKKEKGILFCGSAEGVCIAANKIKGVRAVPAFDTKVARLSREYNDANILCLSGWMLKEKDARRVVDIFLKTKFSNESRHLRRIKQIEKMERER